MLFRSLVKKVKFLAEENLIEQHKKKEIEINFLQEQINPHFLYNTLSSIEQLGKLNEYNKMISIINSLSGFYRLGLNKGKEVIDLKDEFNHTRYYLEILQMVKKNISFSFNISELYYNLKILKFIIQPIVENSVIHGVKHEEKLLISVSVNKLSENLVIIIEDNGIGIEEKTLSLLKKGLKTDDWSEMPDSYGLKNVSNRIKLFYGNIYGLDMDSVYNEGTVIKITVPYITGN